MIRGVELEDFMSYEHAYVPLQPGLNVILGPNGAGKSSILHAIALVLGQSHTERARKLTDLIRWGKDEARISLHMDNQGPDGKKLFPEIRGEAVIISRTLKRNGDYLYHLNDKPAQKQDITQAMHRIGLNPDNLLIVMHQLMVVRFAAVSPQEKLRMFEEALGFQQYRGEVTEALSRLRKASDEERTLRSLLETSRETFEYWQREYSRWQQKEELQKRLQSLEAEQTWAGVLRREASLARLQERIAKAQQEVGAIGAQLDNVEEARTKGERALTEHLKKLRALREQVLHSTRQEERHSVDLSWANRIGNSAPEMASEMQHVATQATSKLGEVRALLAEQGLALGELDEAIDDVRERAIEARVDGEVMRFKRTLLLEEVQRLEAEAKAEREELEGLVHEALKAGPRVQPRKAGEVSVELAQVKEQLKPLAHLSDEVVKVYEQHQRSFEGIQGRAEELAKNKQALRADLDVRIVKWREVVDAELGRISEDYQKLLKEASATGFARLIHSADIERAGLEILAGFKGQDAIALETFAQSGGERSVALMAFLLALQQRIASPFRAVDEFDVHMDPRNRELITNMIVRSAQALEAKGVQSIAITPAPVDAPEGVAVIIVQNAGGGSRVGRLVAP